MFDIEQEKTEVISDLARILRIEDRHLDAIAKEIARGADLDAKELERFLVSVLIAENRLIGVAG